jgi:hypothetical protein
MYLPATARLTVVSWTPTFSATWGHGHWFEEIYSEEEELLLLLHNRRNNLVDGRLTLDNAVDQEDSGTDLLLYIFPNFLGTSGVLQEPFVMAADVQGWEVTVVHVNVQFTVFLGNGYFFFRCIRGGLPHCAVGAG